ncbi:ATP-binding protein [Kineococcus gynurae]|uniref:ATP-binding protein n=1 Tax=Kineococcus gynurae TaxID=452979 RepID=A0ABV5LR01_9ACTN
MTPDVELALPLDARAVSAARRFLREAVCPVHASAVLEDAELLVSELVTNGVRYGLPPITVAVRCRDGSGLTVEVSDSAAREPQPRNAAPDDESGRGMRLVDVISDDWGVSPTDTGKTVWYRLKV